MGTVLDAHAPLLALVDASGVGPPVGAVAQRLRALSDPAALSRGPSSGPIVPSRGTLAIYGGCRCRARNSQTTMSSPSRAIRMSWPSLIWSPSAWAYGLVLFRCVYRYRGPGFSISLGRES